MNILLPLAITLAVESLVYMLFFKWDKRVFVITSILNVFLNVGMNIGLSFVSDITIYWIILSIAEVLTVIIESLVIYLYKKEKYPKVLLIAFIANAMSFLIGLSLSEIYKMNITPIVLTIVFFAIYIFEFIYTFFINCKKDN